MRAKESKLLVPLNSFRAYSTAPRVFAFGVYLVRIQFECGKMRSRKSPNMNTFYTVSSLSLNPRKKLKNRKLLLFSRGIESDQWHEKG